MLKLVKYIGHCSACRIAWMLRMKGSILIDAKNCAIDESHMQIRCDNCANINLTGFEKLFDRMIVVEEKESDI